MSTIKKNIQQKLIEAMKGKDKETIESLRFLMAKIKNLEIEKRGELSDEEIVVLTRKLIKEIQESIVAFEKGGREDLKNHSLKQKEIFSQFLPPELSDEELEKEIKKIIKSHSSLFQKNQNAIIGVAMKKLRGKAQSQRILKIIQKIK